MIGDLWRLRLVAAVAATCLPLVAGAAEPDPWTPENGAAEAAKVAATCLAQAPERERHPCVHRTFELCEAQHGTMSQHDLNDCVGFAMRAWNERLDTQVERIHAVASAPVVEALDASQVRWRVWTEQDCAFQAAPSRGGTIHGMTWGLCRLGHAGARALELERLADGWAEHPP